MWEKLWDYAKRVTSLTRQTEENTEDIAKIREELKEDRQEDKELNQKVDRLTELFQRIAFEFQHDQEKAETDYQYLRQNESLRSKK